MRTTNVLHNARRARAAAETLARSLEAPAVTDDALKAALHVLRDLANVVEDLASVVADIAPAERRKRVPVIAYPEDAHGG